MKKFILNIVLQAVREVINEDVAKRLDRLEYRMDKLEERVDKRIGEREQRIGGFEQRVDKRIGGVEESIKTLTESVINIKGNLEGEARAFHIAGYLKNQTNFGG
jgi:tetrahydromethanopterin S-methyltransferase subunit G